MKICMIPFKSLINSYFNDLKKICTVQPKREMEQVNAETTGLDLQIQTWEVTNNGEFYLLISFFNAYSSSIVHTYCISSVCLHIHVCVSAMTYFCALLCSLNKQMTLVSSVLHLCVFCHVYG